MLNTVPPLAGFALGAGAAWALTVTWFDPGAMRRFWWAALAGAGGFGLAVAALLWRIGHLWPRN